MRHRVAGRKLGRTTEHRTALLRNLSTALFEKEKIRTTLAKAKELRPFAEKLVTMSKKETLHARRLVSRSIHDRAVVSKLLDSLSARYAQRNGGYTRIIKLGPRRGDCAEMAIIELVDSEVTAPAPEAPKKGKRGKAAAKGAEAKEPEAAEAEAEAEAPKRKRTTKKKPARKKAASGAKKAGSSAGAASKKKTKKKASKKTASKGKTKKRD